MMSKWAPRRRCSSGGARQRSSLPRIGAPAAADSFTLRAASMLRGDFRGKAPDGYPHWSNAIRRTRSHADLHFILLRVAESLNQSRPVAARFQSRPWNVRRLVPAGSLAASAATHGVAYNFRSRPRLFQYPRPLRLSKAAQDAVSAELTRLHSIGAIEPAPLHDWNKALDPTCEPWERTPLPPGPWPREQAPPILSPSRREPYDRDLLRDMHNRRRSHLPLRDFESRIFTVPKSDGGLRLCTDSRDLNTFQRKAKFQLDGIKQISQLIQAGDFGCMMDIKDCFLNFGLHPSQRRFTRFRDPQLRRWQWRTLQFGVSECPHLCTRLLRPFMRILRGLGIRCSIYIDDILILSQKPTHLAASVGVALELLQGQLGLQIKTSKCNFAPSQRFTCLGLIWDTTCMKVFVPHKRLKNISTTATRILNRSGAGKHGAPFVRATSKPVRVRDLARLVGLIVSTSPAIFPARRRLLHIQQLLGKSVRRRGWEGELLLNPEAVQAIRWWTGRNPHLLNGHHIVLPDRPLKVFVRSDAATENAAWGGTLQFQNRTWRTRGFFTKTERGEFINQLELLGNRKTVESLLPLAIPKSQWHRVHVHCELDNVTAIKYSNVAVSRSLEMSILGANYFDWRALHNLQMSFQFLRGVDNVEADQLSRVEMSHRDWKLHPSVFKALCRSLRLRAQVDLFASRQNTQVPRFFSWQHDYAALGTNCFTRQWSELGTLYAYPPPILIGRVLQKIRRDEVQNAIAVIPLWMGQTWFPSLLEMTVGVPLLLPDRRWLTLDQWDRPTWHSKWPMIGVHLSSSTRLVKASRRKFFRPDGPALRTAISRSMTPIFHASPDGGIPPQINELVSSLQILFERETSLNS